MKNNTNSSEFTSKKVNTLAIHIIVLMEDQQLYFTVIDEIIDALKLGYLSKNQVEIIKDRAINNLTYEELIKKFNISGKTALTHCLLRTCLLKFWDYSMPGEGVEYLSQYDKDIFIHIIKNTADDQNCVPSIYAVSLAFHIKKYRYQKAFHFLTAMGNQQLASHCINVSPPSKSWLATCIQDTEIRIVSCQQIELLRRSTCDVAAIYFYFELHDFLFKRRPELILNMDETMLSARKRLKVLAAKGQLPLVPENIKLPHMTGCVTFTASGHVFAPLIILPSKKTMRGLTDFTSNAIFASSSAGWMTKNLFVLYAILIVCQVSHYRLTLLEDIRQDRLLLLVDGHPSRYNFKAALILYLFGIDLVLIPPHTSHLLQAFDVAVASPLKTYFKEFIVMERYDMYFANGFLDNKQTARELRNTMLKSFINALNKSATFANIQAGFQSSGIVPVDRNKPLSSEYAVDPTNYDAERLLKCYWLNSEEKLKELFYNESNREVTENDFTVNLIEVFQNIKSSSIHDGIALSDLPPLFVEDADKIQRIVING